MPALTQDRNTLRRDGAQMEPPLAANARIFGGALVAINAAGYAVAGITALGLVGAGAALLRADNTGGAAGAIRVCLSKQPHQFGNSVAADAITLADLGKDCFIVDDQTVAKTDGAGTRSRAGRVFDVDADGVWVDFR